MAMFVLSEDKQGMLTMTVSPKTRALQIHKSNQIIAFAKNNNIKLTSAKFGTDMYQCWADRVEDCYNALHHHDTERYAEMIEEANRYAI
jgi:hypothetical protein